MYAIRSYYDPFPLGRGQDPSGKNPGIAFEEIVAKTHHRAREIVVGTGEVIPGKAARVGIFPAEQGIDFSAKHRNLRHEGGPRDIVGARDDRRHRENPMQGGGGNGDQRHPGLVLAVYIVRGADPFDYRRVV